MPTRAKPKSTLQGVQWPVEPFFKAAIPLPPSVNGSYKTNYSSQFYSSDPLKQFKNEAECKLVDQWNNQDWVIIGAIEASKQKIPLFMDMKIYFDTLWRRDCTGVIKAAEDAVFNFLRINDNRVVRCNAEKYADRDNPRVEIMVSVCVERMNDV
jgi:Holliday junction resolvase RusA-like endonuclease